MVRCNSGVLDEVMGDYDKESNVVIPLIDLVEDMVCYLNDVNEMERNIVECEQVVEKLVLNKSKECRVSRAEELGRLIGKYSDFDVWRVWEFRL